MTPRDRPADAPPERTVWALSAANLRNFGDRLGVHLLSSVLPPNATLKLIHHYPWDAPADETPDLLIVGLGGSLYSHVLDDQLAELVERAPVSIGVFGTQYRDALPVPRLDHVLAHLTTWYARYQDDLDLYGSAARNAVHLGDWLIDAFPMAQGREGYIEVGDEVRSGAPLDKLIAFYQSAERLSSRRLHPLLCGMTAARALRYFRQAEFPGLGISGKFASLLRDVFGEAPPAGAWWGFDRNDVIAYKRHVRTGVEQMRADLLRLLS